MSRGTAFAPATIGNVGPGFDVLGLAVDGIGDTVTVELGGANDVVTVTGRDASLIPTKPGENACVIAAHAMLQMFQQDGPINLLVEKGLPMSGGMGGSAASSVAGALAAAQAAGLSPTSLQLMEAALAGEAAVAGRHLDNIAPCVLGGLALVRSTSPMDVISIPFQAHWFVALVSPAVRVETKTARALLPIQWERSGWVQLMANTTALTVAFMTGDTALVKRALDDVYAEPRRASLIPHFHDVKTAALRNGALGASISGAGPTVFALCENEVTAHRCAAEMQLAFGSIPSTQHVGAVARQGARPA